METKFGVAGVTCDGIFFSEGAIPKGEYRGHVAIEISRQNSSLAAVKQALAAKAKALGANAVSEFTYGQKPHPWWEQIFTFKWDTESWVGSGKALRL